MPYYQQYANHPRYNEITQIMREILKIEGEYKKMEPEKVKEHYRNEQQLLN